MTHTLSISNTPIPTSTYPYRSYLYTSTHKLGSFAGRSVSYLKRKSTKRRAIQSYVILEVLISFISIITLITHQAYLPAILLALMLAYLLYAAIGAF